MPTFGFSAFLKLISLNERPGRTQMRARLTPSAGGGYDFHRSLRLRAHRYLVGAEPMTDIIASVSEIVQAPERRSAEAGLERLEQWRSEHPGVVVAYRIGSVRDRSQTFNPKTVQYVKRDDTSGRFMAAKDGPYKGVAQEPDGRKK